MKFGKVLAFSAVYCFFVSSERSHELYDSATAVIRESFPKECVCFFALFADASPGFLKLLKNTSHDMAVYTVSPAEDVPTQYLMQPLRPYPCSYVVRIPRPGSNIPRMLLRGAKIRGEYRLLSESKYLLIAEEAHTLAEIQQTLSELFSYGFLNVILVNEEVDVNLYTIFPFGRDFRSCPEHEPPLLQVIGSWSQGSLRHKELFPQKLPNDTFQGCLWNISSPFFLPYVIVNQSFESDFYWRHTGPLEGYDAGPISLLTNRLNLTPDWFGETRFLWETTLDNGSLRGAMPNLFLGRGAQMVCGGLAFTWAYPADVTMFYTWTSIKWFLAAPDKVEKWLLLYYAFPLHLWIVLVLVGIAVPLLYWKMARFLSRKTTFSQTLLFLTALTFSNSSGSPPVSTTLRMMFLSWLIYSIHMDNFYVASLTGMMTTSDYQLPIKSVETLLAKNLPTKAYLYTIRVLSRSSFPEVQELLKRRIVEGATVHKVLHDLTVQKNFTFADNFNFVKYWVSITPNVSVYPLPYENMPTTLIGAVMWRHHYLFKRINWLLVRMFDAGFPVFFLSRTVADKFWYLPSRDAAQALKIEDLSSPFYVLAIGLLVSCVAFVGELVQFKMSNVHSMKKNQLEVA